MPARAAASTLSLMPPTGSTRPRSEISPVIARSPRARRPESTETSAVASAMPAEGPSFGHGARRHVQVDLAALERPASRMPERLGVRAHPGERGLGGLAHHVAELAGEPQPHALAAGHRRGLDEEDVAAVAGAREADDDAGHWVGALGGLGQVRRRAERLGDEGGVDAHRFALGFGSATRRAALRTSVAMWRSRFRTPASRVYSWTTLLERVVRDLDLLRREAVRLELLRQQVVARDQRASRARCSRAARSPPCGRAAPAESSRACSRWR